MCLRHSSLLQSVVVGHISGVYMYWLALDRASPIDFERCITASCNLPFGRATGLDAAMHYGV